MDDISISYRELFIQELDSLNNLTEKDKEKQLEEIKSNMEDAIATGKLNELHYTLLKEKLLVYEIDMVKRKIHTNTD